MGKKRKRKRKPTSAQAKKQEPKKINSEEQPDEEAESSENAEELEKKQNASETEAENTDSEDESEEEEQRKSRRQKIAEIDRSLAKTLEAREAGKKKDLRDPLTRFFQDAGKTAVKYKNVISIAIMVVAVVLFLIAYNVVISSGIKVTDWTQLSAENSIEGLQNLARKYEGRDIEAEIYRKLFYAFKNDKKRSTLDKLEGQIDTAKYILNTFENDSDQKDLYSLMKIELPRLEKDLEFLKNRKDKIEKEIVIPDNSTIVLPSDSNKTVKVGLVTDYGTIQLELFDRLCPNTVAAFMYLIEKGFYQEDGLGGSIKRAKTNNGIERLVIGEMPAMDNQNQSKSYESLKDLDDRVKKLAKKWEKTFNDRQTGLGWTLPLEPQGLKQKCEKGVLVAWLNNPSNPESASYKFSILLGADEELTGNYMVIGTVKRVFEDEKAFTTTQQVLPNVKLDAESLKVASQISSNGIKINYTIILRNKAERLYTKLFVKNGEKYNEIGSKRYFVRRGNKEFAADSPDNADYVLANPGMYTFIAKGTYYKNDKNEIVKAEKDMYHPIFPEEITNKIRANSTMFSPFFGLKTSFINCLGFLKTKELEVYKDSIDANGDLLAKKYMPNVIYKDLPMKIQIRKEKPPKVDSFVFTKDKNSPLYFEDDVNSANSTPPQPPVNPNRMNFGGGQGGPPTFPIN